MFRRCTEIKGETVAIDLTVSGSSCRRRTVAAAVLANSQGHTRTSIVAARLARPIA